MDELEASMTRGARVARRWVRIALAIVGALTAAALAWLGAAAP